MSGAANVKFSSIGGGLAIADDSVAGEIRSVERVGKNWTLNAIR
jgi:hypothetical protein